MHLALRAAPRHSSPFPRVSPETIYPSVFPRTSCSAPASRRQSSMRRTPIRTCSGSPNEAQSRTHTRCSRSSRRRTVAASPTRTSRKLAADAVHGSPRQASWRRRYSRPARAAARPRSTCPGSASAAIPALRGGVDAPTVLEASHPLHHGAGREQVAEPEAGERVVLGHGPHQRDVPPRRAAAASRPSAGPRRGRTPRPGAAARRRPARGRSSAGGRGLELPEGRRKDGRGIACAQERTGDQVDELGGAVAGQDAARLQAEMIAQRFAQLTAVGSG